MFDVVDAVNQRTEDRLKLHAVRNKLFKLVDELNPFVTDGTLNKAHLQEVALQLSPDDLLFFENTLRDTIGSGERSVNFDENRRIEVEYGKETYDAKMSLHGQSDNHYKYRKKSYKLKFLDTYVPERFVSWRLLIPDDRGYFSPFIANYVSELFGLPTMQQSFKKVAINGIPYGIYYVEEKYDEKYLEKNGIPGAYIIEFDASKVLFHQRRNFLPETLAPITLPEDYPVKSEELLAIVTDFFVAIESGDTERVVSYLDIERTGAFEAWRQVLGMQHDIENPNLRFVYEFSSGKFFPLPRLEGSIGRTGDPLGSNFFDILDTADDIVAVRDQHLVTLIEHEDELFTYYDELYAEYGGSIMSDSSISRGRRQRKRTIEENRDDLVYNFSVWRQYLANPREESKESISSLPKEATLSVGPLRFTYDQSKQEYVLPAGTYVLHEDVLLPGGDAIAFSSGVTVLLDEDVSLVSFAPIHMRGTVDTPVTIAPTDKSKPFGVVAVQGVDAPSCESSIVHADISGGSEAFVAGVYYSGGLDIYYCDLVMQDTKIHQHTADDGLNVKHGVVTIEDSIFFNNAADQVDLDFTDAHITENTFEVNTAVLSSDGGGDGLDLSGSYGNIDGNTFFGFSDKGISVGEQSTVWVKDNTFESNMLAIAAKDLSHVYIDQNIFSGNMADIEAYQKKPTFGGSSVWIRESEEGLVQHLDVVSEIVSLSEETFDSTIAEIFYE